MRVLAKRGNGPGRRTAAGGMVCLLGSVLDGFTDRFDVLAGTLDRIAGGGGGEG